MKLEVVLSLLLLVTASVLGADPIDLQWRTPLALEEGESGKLKCTAKDNAGNVLVGWALTDASSSKSVLSKLDSSGDEIWRFSLPDVTTFFIREIVTDTAGNVYMVTMTAVGENFLDQQLMVIKLSSSGEELWRCPLGEDARYEGYLDFVVSSSGSVWVCYAIYNTPEEDRKSVV